MPYLRFGVLGASKIGDRSTVPAMNAVDGVEVVAVAARERSRAGEFARRHGISRVEDTYAALVEADDIDAVYIPLPNGLHREWGVRALEAGKHVFIEKSLAGSLVDCRAILDVAREKSLLVVENFMCETHPQSLAVRELIAAGAIGDVRSGSLAFGFPAFAAGDQRNSRALAGGALNDAGAYCLDMAAFYLGDHAVSIRATSARLELDVDAIGSAQIDFASGAHVHVDFGFGLDYRNDASFWGSAGSVSVDRSFSIPPDRLPAVSVTHNTTIERLDLPAADQFQLQIARVRDTVASGQFTDVLDSLERHAVLMEAFRVSADENRVVRVDEFTAAEALRG